jgi:hypothetical protein
MPHPGPNIYSNFNLKTPTPRIPKSLIPAATPSDRGNRHPPHPSSRLSSPGADGAQPFPRLGYFSTLTSRHGSAASRRRSPLHLSLHGGAASGPLSLRTRPRDQRPPLLRFARGGTAGARCTSSPRAAARPAPAHPSTPSNVPGMQLLNGMAKAASCRA